MKPETIIWSADVGTDDLKKVVDAKALPEGTVIKLDRKFFEEVDDGDVGWNNRKDWILYCQSKGYPVFADAKIIEIPDKSLGIAEIYLAFHPWMLNIMAGACSTGVYKDENLKKVDALKRFADACKEAGTKSCAVTVLTSKTDGLCRNEFGESPLDQVMKYCDMMRLAGLTDVVCSPKEAKQIRRYSLYDSLKINTPGVRLPKTDVRDQARVTTPAEALSNGADRLVIGSNLTDGDGDIVERIKRNYDRIMENISSVI